MSFSLGVGIVTYDRKDIVRDTIDRVKALTRHAGTALVVADDGSSDGTAAMLRERRVPVVSGINMGIAWNKNRALFLLSHMLHCETVILLEDDTQPNRPGWEQPWIEAAERWGHANFAASWMDQHFAGGRGTAAEPFASRMVTAQCAVYSRTALTFGGYFDPRFRGYGHEHVEHTGRLIQAGFGGKVVRAGGQDHPIYYLIRDDISVVRCESHFNHEQEARNHRTALSILDEQGFRAPWGNDAEMRQFRSEIESAMSGGTERFRLTPDAVPAPRRGTLLRRLFRRA